MVDINWGLLQPAHPEQSVLSGLQAGQQMGQQRGIQSALSQYGTDPQGAIDSLIRVGALSQAGALDQMQQTRQKRDADITAGKTIAAALSTPASTDPLAKPVPLMGSAGVRSGLAQAAAGGHLDAMSAIQQTVGQMDKAQASAYADKLQSVAQVGQQLQEAVPLADPAKPTPDEMKARQDYLAQHTSLLTSHGLTPDVVPKLDLSDTGINGLIAGQMSVKEYADSNLAHDKFDWQKATDKAQADLAAKKAAEELRHDKATEDTSRLSASASMMQAHTAAGKAAQGEWQILTDPKTNTTYRYNPMTLQATTLTGEDYSPQGAAKISGGGAPRSAAAAAVQKFIQENPNATADDVSHFNANLQKQKSAVTAFATGKQGQTVNSLNVGISHLDQLQELANALGNGDVQAINRISQAIKQETGQAAPTNFDAAKQLVGDEIVKGIVGSGGGVADREKAQKSISRASSPEQLAGVIKTYKGLLGGQLSGLKLQYKNSTGLDDFETHLDPRTRTELEGNAAAPKRMKFDAQGNPVQ